MYINYENEVFRNKLSLIDRNGIVQLNYSKVHTCKFGYERIVKLGDEFYVCDLDANVGKVKVGSIFALIGSCLKVPEFLY